MKREINDLLTFVLQYNNKRLAVACYCPHRDLFGLQQSIRFQSQCHHFLKKREKILLERKECVKTNKRASGGKLGAAPPPPQRSPGVKLSERPGLDLPSLSKDINVVFKRDKAKKKNTNKHAVLRNWVNSVIRIISYNTNVFPNLLLLLGDE